MYVFPRAIRHNELVRMCHVPIDMSIATRRAIVAKQIHDHMNTLLIFDHIIPE